MLGLEGPGVCHLSLMLLGNPILSPYLPQTLVWDGTDDQPKSAACSRFILPLWPSLNESILYGSLITGSAGCTNWQLDYLIRIGPFGESGTASNLWSG